MRLVFSIVRRAQHQSGSAADEMGTIGGLICGQPESVALEVINDVRRAYCDELRSPLHVIVGT